MLLLHVYLGWKEIPNLKRLKTIFTQIQKTFIEFTTYSLDIVLAENRKSNSGSKHVNNLSACLQYSMIGRYNRSYFFLCHSDTACDPWGGCGCVLLLVAVVVVVVVQCSFHGNRLRVSGDGNRKDGGRS